MDQRMQYYSYRSVINNPNTPVNIGNTINNISDVIHIDLDIC